jgi:hypothetical protein
LGRNNGSSELGSTSLCARRSKTLGGPFGQPYLPADIIADIHKLDK